MEAYLRLLIPYLLAFCVQPATSNVDGLAGRDDSVRLGSTAIHELLAAREWHSPPVAGNSLFERQDRCDPGWYACPNFPGSCCQSGYNCFAAGCCSQALPNLVPCPDPTVRWCYDPSQEKCCPSGGPCPTDLTCCGDNCCTDFEYCGADNACTSCPAETVTKTAVLTSTTTLATQKTITEIEPPEEASDFSCVPLTVTNEQGAELELGTDCALEYSPPDPTTSDSTSSSTPPTTTTAAAAAAAAAGGTIPQRRAAPSCTPLETSTETAFSTSTVTRRTTTTQTVTATTREGEPQLSFSCPPMEATNAAGDVLALDEDCSLELSLAAPSSSAGATAGGGGGGGAGGAGGSAGSTGGGGGGGGPGQSSDGNSIRGHRLSVFWASALVGLCLLLGMR
ncbi:hypothetical protein VTK56DRAFT_2077 [Thermocarpiscus australiensis]